MSDSLSGKLLTDGPPLVGSLLAAELFFRFGSFALECVVFLGVWYVFKRLYEGALKVLNVISPEPHG